MSWESSSQGGGSPRTCTEEAKPRREHCRRQPEGRASVCARPTGRGRECCQCGSVASSNVANFQLGIGNAKLPNGMLPNCRTDSRQTTERFFAKLPNGYCAASVILILCSRYGKKLQKSASCGLCVLDRGQKTEDKGFRTLDGCGSAELMVTYRRFQKREK